MNQNVTPEEWLASKAWSNGFAATPDVSVNASEFMEQYEKDPALWDKVFKFLAENDLNALPLGNIDIEKGRAWAIVNEYVPAPAEDMKIESHRKFTDLQYVLSGNEKMGLARDAEISEEYDSAKDCAFWKSDKIDYFKAGPQNFFLFFPADLHQPSVLDGEPAKSRKIIVKIEYK